MDGIDLLVKNGAVWTPGGFVDADIAVKDGKIAALGKPPVLPDTAAAMIDAKGMKVIPGLIDTITDVSSRRSGDPTYDCRRCRDESVVAQREIQCNRREDDARGDDECQGQTALHRVGHKGRNIRNP